MMNIKRLQLMSTMLGEVTAGSWKQTVFETVDGGKVVVGGFDLTDWVEAQTEVPLGTNPIACGFSACAVGHACFDERFTSQGLQFDLKCNTPVVEGITKYEDENSFDTTWRGVNSFFGISSRTGDLLFFDQGYIIDPDNALVVAEGVLTEGLEVDEDGELIGKVTPAMVKERIDDLLNIGEQAFLGKYYNFAGE